MKIAYISYGLGFCENQEEEVCVSAYQSECKQKQSGMSTMTSKDPSRFIVSMDVFPVENCIKYNGESIRFVLFVHSFRPHAHGLNFEEMRDENENEEATCHYHHFTLYFATHTEQFNLNLLLLLLLMHTHTVHFC